MDYSNAFREDELPKVAEELLRYFPNSKIFLFRGNLGSGKTSLIKAMCAQMNVQDHVNSPTYGLVNVYESPTHGRINHFDLYRLKSEAEALDIGIEDYFDENAFCFVEWPELIVSLVPENYVDIHMRIVDHHRAIRAQQVFV